MSSLIQPIEYGQVRRCARALIPCNEPLAPSFGLSLFGFRIHIEAPSTEVMDLLARCVYPSIPRRAITPVEADLCIRIAQEENEFRIYRDDVPVASAMRNDELVRALIDCLDRAFIAGVKSLHAVHAGAVSFDDRVLLLPGASHSGKSSLVAELLRHGAVCFSDEYALVDREGLIHPYPRPLLLRNGGYEQTPVLPIELNSNVATARAKVGWILSLRFDKASAWQVKQVPQSLALLELLRNSPHVLADSPEMAASFQAAVAPAKCFEGARGESIDAANRILQLVSSCS